MPSARIKGFACGSPCERQKRVNAPGLKRVSGTWLACPAVARDLILVRDEIARTVASRDQTLDALSKHLSSRAGKGLRPALLLLARGGKSADIAALKSAAAVELIHVASLYHDDIMDRSEMRWGAATVNARWGNGVAALGGTFLLARSQRLLLEVGQTAAELGATAAARLCAGELRELENAYNLESRD